MKRLFSLHTLAQLVGPLAFGLILWYGPAEGMSQQALAVLATTIWVAIWWITEVVPIPVTSMLPMVLLPVTGAMPVGDVTASYGNHLVFLYVGGFMLAIAIEKWNLHRRIALTIIKLVGVGERKIILGFMLATGFLSMWISNTATSVMMLPIGMAIVSQLRLSGKVSDQFGKALMLGIAYSASIGGMATLIGTPPNLVLAEVVHNYYGIELIFSDWIVLMFPLSLVLLLICWLYLTRIGFRLSDQKPEGVKSEISEQLKALGPVSWEERAVLWVFAITAALWISRPLLLADIAPGVNDTVIAIAGALALFILPGKAEKRVLDWESAVKLPWGIVLLFGGGLAMAEGFRTTHLAEYIGTQMEVLQYADPFWVMFSVVALVNFLTEITSNVATTSMILPVLAAMSDSLGANPLLLMCSAALAASCAFMLPVATPPNAVVFGSGYLEMRDMVKAGFVMNIVSIILISIYIFVLLPLLWNV